MKKYFAPRWSPILLLGCASAEPTVTEAEAAPFVSVLVRLDLDRDGRLVESEYSRVWKGEPRFQSADKDGDGALSALEVAIEVIETDPLRFNQMEPDGPPSADSHRLLKPPPGPLWEALVFLSAEEEAKDPTAARPSLAVIKRAAEQGMASADGQEVIATLVAGGIDVPPSVRTAGPDLTGGPPGGPPKSPRGPPLPGRPAGPPGSPPPQGAATPSGPG